jgi:uncharacterized membrane protein
MLNRKSKALQLGQFIALLASLLIAAQIGFILFQGTPFCLNGGCKVVEKLTRVSPLVFNLAGLFFFQVVYWGLRASKNEPRRLPQFVRPLLLAGLAVEAVLITFQYQVAQAFCAYCLGILTCVFMLNLLLGFKHALPGLFLFAAVSLAFTSLEVNPPTTKEQAFTAGIFASRPGSAKESENFLFYSSTCAHCERVIAALKKDSWATVHFNPIDQVKRLDLPGTTVNPTYSPATNRGLLTTLGIEEIPVLITKTPEGLSIRRGETAILAYLGKARFVDSGGQSSASSAPASPAAIPGLESKDGCSVATECTDGGAGTSRQPAR